MAGGGLLQVFVTKWGNILAKVVGQYMVVAVRGVKPPLIAELPAAAQAWFDKGFTGVVIVRQCQSRSYRPVGSHLPNIGNMGIVFVNRNITRAGQFFRTI